MKRKSPHSFSSALHRAEGVYHHHDAQNDAERPAARKRHEHKGDDPPDLTHQQGRAAQAQIKRDILIDEQFHGIDQDLRTHQDRDEVRDADAAILPLQFG